MKTNLTSGIQNRIVAAIAAAVISSSFALPQHAFAGGKATDPAGAPSTGGAGGGGGTSTGGGGGGGGGNKPTAPKPAPAPILSAALTFTAPVTVNGVVPQATGSYRIDPYYPTLSLMTLNVSGSSINDPDGSLFYVNVTTTNSYYGVGAAAFTITAGAGSATVAAYVVPGTTVTSVTVTDSLGNVILTGN